MSRPSSVFGDSPNENLGGVRLIAPYVEAIDLAPLNLGEISYELFLSGDWNPFIEKTIHGDEVAIDILKRQVYLQPDEFKNVYVYMIKNSNLNIYDIKERFPGYPICDRIGKQIDNKSSILRALEIVRKGYPNPSLKSKKDRDQESMVRSLREYDVALDMIVDMQFHLSIEDLGTLKKYLRIFKGDRGAVMDAKPSLSHISPEGYFPQSRDLINYGRGLKENPQHKLMFLKEKEPAMVPTRRPRSYREEGASTQSSGREDEPQPDEEAFSEVPLKTSTPFDRTEEVITQMGSSSRGGFSGGYRLNNPPRGFDRFDDQPRWQSEYARGYTYRHPRGGANRYQGERRQFSQPRNESRFEDQGERPYFRGNRGGFHQYRSDNRGGFSSTFQDARQFQTPQGERTVSFPSFAEGLETRHHYSGNSNPRNSSFNTRDRFSGIEKQDLNTSVVYKDPPEYEYQRSQFGNDHVDRLTARMVNSGLLSREGAAKAFLEGAIIKEGLSKKEFGGRGYSKVPVDSSVNKLLEDFDFRPNGRSIDEILGDRFKNTRFGSEVERTQIKLKLLEFIASHPSCSMDTKIVCLDELGRSPISRFHRDQLDSSQILPRPYLNTIMPGKESATHVEVPILGNQSAVTPNMLKFLQTSMSGEKLSIDSGSNARSMSQLLDVVADHITSQGYTERTAYQLLEAVSKGSLLDFIRDMKGEETFANFWNQMILLFGSTVKKSSCESELKQLIKHKPTPATLASSLLKIRNICRKVALEEEPEHRVHRMTSDSLRWARKLIRIHYIHYLQNIEMMFQDEKERMKNIRKLGSSYGLEERTKNDYDIYMAIACNHIASFAVDEDHDRDIGHHRSRNHASTTKDDTNDTTSDSSSEDEIRVSEAKIPGSGRHRDKKRHDRSRDRSTDREKDRHKRRQRSHDRTHKSPHKGRDETHVKEASVQQQRQPQGQVFQQGFGNQMPQPPQQISLPSSHPTMIPVRFQPNRSQNQHGQGHLPKVWRTVQGNQVIRVVSDRTKRCRNCNLIGHEYTTCFKYPEPPTDTQCSICEGYHKGECKRFFPQNRMMHDPNRQARHQGNHQGDRFPMNQGLGNVGRQAMPANQADIQRKNQMQGPQPNRDPTKTVFVHVARAEYPEEFDSGSGYNYFMDASGLILEEQNMSQITEEELAEMQEAEGLLLEDEISNSSAGIGHRTLNEN